MRALAMVVLAGIAPVLQDEGLRNGSFSEWRDGSPPGWTVEVGARNGDGPPSKLEPIEGGVALSGDASTRAWRLLRQSVPVKPGTPIVLEFRAGASGLKREGAQFDNAYVALAFLDGEGRALDTRLRTPVSSSRERDRLMGLAPGGSVRAEVRIFLSKTGRLEVADLRLEHPKPAASFDLLVDELDRRYAHFVLKKVDWKELVARHREAATAAGGAEEFAAAVKPMLAALEDPHVWIRAPGRALETPWSPEVERNYDYRAVAKRLKGVKQIGRVGFVGRTDDGIGYAAIGTLQGDDKTFAELEAAIEGLFDAPAIVLDLRANGGGDERRAQRIAGRFCDRARVYARHKVRAGAAHDAFTPPMDRMLEPRGEAYTRPVVVLTGRGCISSGEGFVLMLKSLPHVTLVGQPTRGASGNPQPVELPNGVVVWYSTWVSMLPDGSTFEGGGIAPDTVVKHEGEGDPTFERGVEAAGKKR